MQGTWYVSKSYLPTWNANDFNKKHLEFLMNSCASLLCCPRPASVTVRFVAEIETSRASSLSSSKMDSKSGVVGKFRSFYSTIEQVK